MTGKTAKQVPAGAGPRSWLGHPLLVLALALLSSGFAMSGNRFIAIHNTLPYEEQNHVQFVSAAIDSMREGSLLLREVPRMAKPAAPIFRRYPVYQFYGNFPFFIGATLGNLGLEAYTAFLLLGYASFVIGFIGTFLAARALGLRAGSALAGALLFTLAPYHLMDWYGRFAFTETFALGMLPLALYGALKASRERSALAFAFSAAAWSAVMMSHTIMHIYGALIIFGVLAVNWCLLDRRDWAALWRPFAAYALGFACVAWSLWPIIKFGDQFSIAHWFNPRDWAYVSGLKYLLARSYLPHPQAGFMGFQIGWPLLFALLASPFLFLRRPWVAIFSVFMLLAVYLAWSPNDVWPHLGPLAIIQFPYRILAFVVLTGSVLTAALWDAWVRRFEALWLLPFALLIVLAAKPYVLEGGNNMSAAEVNALYSQGGVHFQGPPADYVINDPNSAWMTSHYPTPSYDLGPVTMTAALAEGVDWHAAPVVTATAALQGAAAPGSPSASVEFGPLTRVKLQGLRQGDIIQLPMPWYPKMFAFTVNGKSAPYGRVDRRLAWRAPGDGDFNIEFRFRGLLGANALSLLGWLIFMGLLAFHFMTPKKKSEA